MTELSRPTAEVYEFFNCVAVEEGDGKVPGLTFKVSCSPCQ